MAIAVLPSALVIRKRKYPSPLATGICTVTVCSGRKFGQRRAMSFKMAEETLLVASCEAGVTSMPGKYAPPSTPPMDHPLCRYVSRYFLNCKCLQERSAISSALEKDTPVGRQRRLAQDSNRHARLDTLVNDEGPRVPQHGKFIPVLDLSIAGIDIRSE